MTIYLPPPGRLIQGWRLSRQNLNFVEVKIWFPPDVREANLWYVFIPPPFRVSAVAYKRTAHKACSMRAHGMEPKAQCNGCCRACIGYGQLGTATCIHARLKTGWRYRN
jgi:hypothetical protein